jgi:hypothetical protein
MIFFEVYTGDQDRDYFVSMKSAIREAKSLIQENSETIVYRVDIGRITKETIRRCLSGRQFAISRIQVWPPTV